MDRCDKPTGKMAPMKFLYPELGAIDPKRRQAERLQQLANVITSEQNGRLSRTIVNRLWKRLLGRGIIEPVDEMDHIPWNADLLDWLAWSWRTTNKYDIKKTIATIMLAGRIRCPRWRWRARSKGLRFAGPGVKRMTAEEFVDAVSTMAGEWTGKTAAKLPDNAERYAKAKWIWSSGAANSAPPGTIYLPQGDRLSETSSRQAIVTATMSFSFT